MFEEVYEERGTPAAVRRNILPYVEELQLRMTRVRYAANIITDSNPSRVADGGTIYFNGVPLNFEPPRKKSTEFGIEPWVSVEKIWPTGFIGKFRGSARIFEDSELNSARIYSSFAKRLPQISDMFVQASLEAEVWEDGSYGLPTVETWKIVTPTDTIRLGVGGQFGYLLSDNSDISGVYIRPYAFGDWSVLHNATILAAAAVEMLDSNNDYYSYISPKLEVGLHFTVGDTELTPLVSVTSTRFRDFDPFWGVTREDLTIRSSVTVWNNRLSYRGVTPTLTVFHEDRDSNIEINSYTQIGGSVSFRKLF